jgi:hypothetical protein
MIVGLAAPTPQPLACSHRRWPNLNRMTGRWFATDDDDEIDEAQQAVLDVLRARANSDDWPTIDPADTNVALPDYVSYGYPLQPDETSFGKVLAWLNVPDPAQRLSLLTVGVYFTETGMRGDCLHNQLLTLPTEPTHLAVNQSGLPQEMAHRAADWFRGILQRPIVRYEWLRDGRVYAQRWLFADSGHSLIEGRVRTGELGSPDRRIHIRGVIHGSETAPTC